MKVLIADDSRLQRKILGDALESAGYEIVLAKTGQEAFVHIMESNEPPPICLLDWCMPEVSGIELARMIRNRGLASYTYVILITANTSATSLQEGFSAGADDFVRKPCDTNEVLARVRAGERIVALEAELRKAMVSLRHQADHDRLTGLLNRGAILDGLGREHERAVRSKNAITIYMFDIDHFKKVNDTYGHPTGDQVLQQVARTLRRSIRPYDLAGRYGGEEFLVVLPNCSQEAAMVRAEEVRSAIASCTVDSLGFETTISVGVAGKSAAQSFTISELLQSADLALYAAKRGGRNRVEPWQAGKGGIQLSHLLQ
jgi:diguanylate cyclase (GGDEF)-like protein